MSAIVQSRAPNPITIAAGETVWRIGPGEVVKAPPKAVADSKPYARLVAAGHIADLSAVR